MNEDCVSSSSKKCEGNNRGRKVIKSMGLQIAVKQAKMSSNLLDQAQ